MTYGEALLKRREEAEMVNGETTLTHEGLPIRMSQQDAIKYYNDKLYRYWLTQLDGFGGRREKALDYLLGRTDC